MRLATITPCLAPSASYIKLLAQSADRHRIDLIPHGIGSPFVDWRHMLLEHTVPAMRRLREVYTHVLYVDGRDSIFMSGEAEILDKYTKLDSPACLMSHDDPAPLEVKVNAGGYIAELPFMIDLWELMARRYPDDGDYQRWLHKSWPVPGIECDTMCTIFQSVEEGMGIASRRGRFINTVTGSKPCVLHFRGGYADPATGREHRILPVLKAMGI